MGQALVLGAIAGGIYGLFAVGIVLVYRGSNAINFAQGEIGTVGLYVAWYLVTDRGMPWIVGAAVAIAVGAAIGAGFERVIVRPMIDASRVAVAVATVGLLSFLVAVESKFFTGSPRSVGPPIKGTAGTVFGVVISPTQVLALVVTAAVGAGLALLLKRTDFGLGVLAAAQDATAARMVGVPLGRVSSFVWAAGAGASVLGALLIEPTVGVFAPGFASELFLRGLAAAVIGGLTSLTGAFVGGMTIGILEAAAARLFADASLPGIRSLTTFVVILAVLLLRPGGVLAGWRLRAGASA